MEVRVYQTLKGAAMGASQDPATLHSYETVLEPKYGHDQHLAVYNAARKRQMSRSTSDPIGSTSMTWDEDEDSWYAGDGDHQFLCGDDSAAFMNEGWREESDGVVELSVYNSVFYSPQEESTAVKTSLSFMVFAEGHERIMVQGYGTTDVYNKWESFPIYSALDTFLREDCKCVPGKVYVATFSQQPAFVTRAYTVTKRRRITLDIEVDVECDTDGRPISSPGKILYEEGCSIVQRFKDNPHFFGHRVLHWNVDHVVIGSSPSELVNDKDDGVNDYLRFNDRPGIWSCDHVNNRRVKA